MDSIIKSLFTVVLWIAFLFLPSGVIYADSPSIYPRDLNFGVVEPGLTYTDDITISSGDTTLTDITISVSGVGSQWVSFSTTYISEIPAGSERRVIVYLRLPQDASADSYACTINVEASGYSGSVTLTFEVPISIQLSPDDIDVSIFTGENKSLQLTIKSLNADIDITLSASADISNWVVLPAVGLLGKGASIIKQIEVRVPGGAVEPVGKYSGDISIQYSGGGEYIPTTIEIFPAKSWFDEISSEISLLPSWEHVCQIIGNSASNNAQTKEALHSIVDLVKEDPSHFYDITKPCLETSIATYRLLAIDLPDAFNKEQLAQCDNILSSSNANLLELKGLLDEEKRTDYKGYMRSIYDQLSSIQDGWGKAVACSKAEAEETAGDEDYNKGLTEKLLIPSRDLFISAKAHFKNCAALYQAEPCNDISEVEYCEERKRACENQETQRNQEIIQTKNRGNEYKDAGVNALREGRRAIFAPTSLKYYSTALEHLQQAREEFSKLGGDEGEALEEEVTNLIQEVKEAMPHEKFEIALYILPFLIVIALMGKRYLSMRSIRRDMKIEEQLFREL